MNKQGDNMKERLNLSIDSKLKFKIKQMALNQGRDVSEIVEDWIKKAKVRE